MQGLPRTCMYEYGTVHTPRIHSIWDEPHHPLARPFCPNTQTSLSTPHYVGDNETTRRSTVLRTPYSVMLQTRSTSIAKASSPMQRRLAKHVIGAIVSQYYPKY